METPETAACFARPLTVQRCYYYYGYYYYYYYYYRIYGLERNVELLIDSFELYYLNRHIYIYIYILEEFIVVSVLHV